MNIQPVHIYFDFIDPLSYLLARELEVVLAELRAADGGDTFDVRWTPFELRPPPTPLTTSDDPTLAARWHQARALEVAAGLEFRPGHLVPWTRKAHELLLHAATANLQETVRTAIFECWLLEGRDIGRVDVLVELARDAGLDVTETKAVLDVDRFEADVAAAREAALSAGITNTPLLARGDRRLEGFHNRTALGTFLGT